MGKETERIESQIRSLYKQRETSLFLYNYLHNWCSALPYQRLLERNKKIADLETGGRS